MQILTALSLIVIGLTWLHAWRLNFRWVRGIGVDETASAWALACTLPTVGLVLAVHTVALVGLLTGTAIVTPALVAVVFLALVIASGAAFLAGTNTADANVDSVPRSGIAWPLRVAILVVAAMYAVFLVDALTRFPTGYDGLHYHLPAAVRWMQTQRLDLILGVKHQSFPENGMIVPFLLSFAGLERLINVVHLPKALLVALCVFGLTRAIGATRRAGLAGALIALSVPMVVFQSVSSYIDLYVAASWLAALLALTWASRAADDRARRDLLLMAGLSAGVALGGKTTQLLLVPLLGLVAVGTEWLRPHMVKAVPRPARAAAVFGLACLAGSGFWFIRGSVQAGNPVYPLAVDVAGTRVLPGFSADLYFPERSITRRVHRWWDYPWREPKHSGTGYPYSGNNALGGAYAAFVPVGLLAVLCTGGLARPRSLDEQWRRIFLALSVAGGLILLTVFHEMLRFVLPLLLVSVPLGAWLIDRASRRRQRAPMWLLALALFVTALIATLKPAHALAGRIKDGAWDRASFYEIPGVIDELEPGSRILNLAELPATYPLMGRRLDHEVITAIEWEHLRAGVPMSAQALRDHDIRYIYIRAPFPEDWPGDLPVELIYDDASQEAPLPPPHRRLYRVLPAS